MSWTLLLGALVVFFFEITFAGHQDEVYEKISNAALLPFNLEAQISGNKAISDAFRSLSLDVCRRSPLVMVTFIFGPKRFQEESFPFFIASARGCGASVLIIGDCSLPSALLPLPDNIWYHQITWNTLVSRAEHVYAKPFEFQSLRNVAQSTDGQGHVRGQYFKIVDFKPLVAMLFPNLLVGCDWWGYIDNDIWLGDLRTHVLPQLISGEADFYGKDVDSALFNGPAYGPFTLQRNNQNITSLMNSSSSREIVRMVLKIPHPVCFSEWGKEDWGGLGFNHSYSGIIMAAQEAGFVRLGHIRQAFLWDMPCGSGSPVPAANCTNPELEQKGKSKLCVIRTQGYGNGFRSELSMRNCDGSWQSCFYCHFQFGKSQTSLTNLSKHEQAILLRQSTLARSYHCGIFSPEVKFAP